jgi:hypothetical protein
LRPKDARRPLRCCAAARRDVCHDGVSKENMLVREATEVEGRSW